MNPRQIATVLAALRYWQREGLMSCGHEHDIASDNDTIKPLTASEIDDLCEDLNCPSTVHPVQDPELCRLHDNLSDLLETPTSPHPSIRDAAVDLCAHLANRITPACHAPTAEDESSLQKILTICNSLTIMRGYVDEDDTDDAIAEAHEAIEKIRTLATPQPSARKKCLNSDTPANTNTPTPPLEHLAILDLARDQHGSEQIKIDDGALLSKGDDNGCFVSAWVWTDFTGTALDKSATV
jgi:hypothetical protein